MIEDNSKNNEGDGKLPDIRGADGEISPIDSSKEAGVDLEAISDELVGVQSSSFSGPLPPPAMLKEYNDVIADGAERIFSMTEQEQNSRHELIRGALANEKLKILCATAVSLALIIAAAWAAYLSQPWLSGLLATIGILTGLLRQIIEWLSPEQPGGNATDSNDEQQT